MNKNTERNILIAFFLNFFFALIEIFGGLFTGSIAILSDAVHDLGDALSIGVSYFLERKSKQKADAKYTYGYKRYSLMGSLLTNTILILGSVFVIYHAVIRIFNPREIYSEGMIVFAIFGLIVNSIAAYVTRDPSSYNQKAVNLHMLEDVLGWAVVLVGAIVMHFTNFLMIDSLLSIAVSIFIAIHAVKNLSEVLKLLLDSVPEAYSLEEIEKNLRAIEGVQDVHHMHLRSTDGHEHDLSLHIVSERNGRQIKTQAREVLASLGINHCTIELETPDEEHSCEECVFKQYSSPTHHHHH